MIYNEDLTGQTFHKWRVEGYSHHNKQNQKLWLCVCNCGTKRFITSGHLRHGASKSCRKCSAKVVAKKHHVTHGLSTSKVYRCWCAIKSRCYNVKQKAYERYGAEGVTVAPEWMHDFQAFYTHIGPPPSEAHSIDRINPFGNYEPGNVRWATASEQMRNTKWQAFVRAYDQYKTQEQRMAIWKLWHEGAWLPVPHLNPPA